MQYTDRCLSGTAAGWVRGALSSRGAAALTIGRYGGGHRREKRNRGKLAVRLCARVVPALLFAAFPVIGRLICGVHWRAVLRAVCCRAPAGVLFMCCVRNEA